MILHSDSEKFALISIEFAIIFREYQQLEFIRKSFSIYKKYEACVLEVRECIQSEVHE